MYEIDFYFDSNGKSPVSDYIVALSKSHQKNDRAILKNYSPAWFVTRFRTALKRTSGQIYKGL